jgi:hypothetical protein
LDCVCATAVRRQYLYHPQFRAEQEQAKHEHVLDVAEALPAVREAVEGHLRDRGLTRQRVPATAVRLLDLGFFRIGSDRYTEQNSSYGLTALLRRRGGGDRLLAYRERRAWHATVMAAVALAVSQPVARSETARRRAIARATRGIPATQGPAERAVLRMLRDADASANSA